MGLAWSLLIVSTHSRCTRLLPSIAGGGREPGGEGKKARFGLFSSPYSASLSDFMEAVMSNAPPNCTHSHSHRLSQWSLCSISQPRPGAGILIVALFCGVGEGMWRGWQHQGRSQGFSGCFFLSAMLTSIAGPRTYRPLRNSARQGKLSSGAAGGAGDNPLKPSLWRGPVLMWSCPAPSTLPGLSAWPCPSSTL